MEITLSDGRVVRVLLIDIAHNYVDWEFLEVPGHNRTEVALTDYASALTEIQEAIEIDLGLIEGGE